MNTCRKLLSALLCLALLASVLPLGAVPARAAGEESTAVTAWDGTADTNWYKENENEFTLSTAAQLAGLAQLVNGGNNFSGKTITLDADIDLNPGASYDPTTETWINGDGQPVAEDSLHKWTPIGNYSNNFTGTFDGGGNTVSGLYISNSDEDYLGLFGWVGDSGTVKNLTVSGSVSGGDSVGSVVGRNYGSVSGCSNTGSVSGDYHVGGVVGRNQGSVSNCYNTVSFNVTGELAYVGGIVGYNDFDGSISSCYNTGLLTVSGSSAIAGGIVGLIGGGVVNSCYNTGKITGTTAGGVAGWNSKDGSVSNCYNTGEVSGKTAGGVVGENHFGDVANCYNNGTINGTGESSYAGGVVGVNSYAGISGTVSNCYWLNTASDLGIGDITSTNVTNVEPKTTEEFASGEVAWLLQNAVDEEQGQVWGQQLSGDTDSYPVFTSDSNKKVYQVTLDYNYVGAPENAALFTNSKMTKPADPTREGYTFSGWYSDGACSNAWDFENGTVTEGMILYAKWTVTPTYTVTVAASSHGSVTANPTSAAAGETVTLTIAPETGYTLADLNVADANGTAITVNDSENTYAFTMPDSAVTVTATFRLIDIPVDPAPTPIPDPDPSGPSTGESDGWESIADEITADDDGDSITIDMNGETEVPADIFEDVAGKDVDLVFDMGDGLSWSVNGQDIPTDVDFSDLDLGVDLGTDGIPVDVINAITGELGSVQLTLAYDGEFGFTLTLTAPLGEDNAGYWANLYHYDEDAEALDF